jgi:choline kinase
MKGIILAAGLGSRLENIGNSIPKTLLKVNGKPILSFILESFQNAGIRDIIICYGYKSDKIIDFCKSYSNLNFTFIENTKFNVSNNLYSLYLARDHFDDEVIITDGDIVPHPVIIKDLVKQKKTTIVVDENSYIREIPRPDSKNDVSKKHGIRASKKLFHPLDVHVCIIKIGKNDLGIVKNEIERIIEKENNFNDFVWATIRNLLKEGLIDVETYNIKTDYWHEIDTPDDLRKTENFLKTSNLF